MAALLLFIGYSVVVAVVRGGSLDVFWDWFLAGPDAPFYGSLPDITLVQALGISLIVTLLTYHHSSADQEANKGKGATALIMESIGVSVVFYVTFWIFAIIYHGLA